MGKSERRFAVESLIISYKETEDPSLFEDILKNKDIRNYIRYTCLQKLRNCPTTLYTLDDFMSISYLILWQTIQKYKFICPVCGISAKSHAAYKLHTMTKHEEYIEPSVSISRYIKFNIGAYLQNEVRREYSQERKSNVMTINIFTTDEVNEYTGDDSVKNDKIQFDIASDFSIEDDIIFKDTVNKMVNHFDSQTREIFNYIFNDRLKQREIASILCMQGKYSSEQSAAVVVSRTVKNKIKPVVEQLYPELVK